MRRVASVVDRVVDAPVSVEVSIPAGATMVFLIIERHRIEALPEENICEVVMRADNQHIGGGAWAGGRLDFSEIRPGRVLPWSQIWMPLPAGCEVLRLAFNPLTEQHLTAHVDID